KRLERAKLDALLAFAESTRCRRQQLLAYFGETLERPCGNCDNCLDPPATWDATEAAQKALSCVYRTGQRFGVGYLIDVLLGKDNERIQAQRHDHLSVHGIGTELDARQWRGVFRQLVARGLLSPDLEGYGTLRLTRAAHNAAPVVTPTPPAPATASTSRRTRNRCGMRCAICARNWPGNRACRPT